MVQRSVKIKVKEMCQKKKKKNMKTFQNLKYHLIKDSSNRNYGEQIKIEEKIIKVTIKKDIYLQMKWAH